MDRKNKFIKYLKLWILLSIVLIGILISSYQLIILTNTRYIKIENDEIRGYYTSLHMQGTGEGNCIVLENNIGYTTFKLMNYEGEDVTKRDIEYNIQTLSTFYDVSGNVIDNSELDKAEKLYVKDVWDRPKEIQKDTYKYDITVKSSDAEKGNNATHMFSYQEIDNKGIGKTHNITLQLKRKDEIGKMGSIENISIVVELVKPYKEVFIINMVVVNRLIAFANTDVLQFDVDFQRLNIQTADAFKSEINSETANKITISPNAFKVVLQWENLIIDKRDLEILHNVNGTQPSDLDITMPYIISFSINRDNNSGTLEIYIPQSSSINIDFFPVNTTYSVKAQVYYYNGSEYKLYDNSAGGHDYSKNSYIFVLHSDKNNIVH